MGNLRKEDFFDLDIVDQEELLSSGSTIYLSNISVVSTTGSSKNIRTTGYYVQSDDDDRLESGDIFVLTGSTAADGTYTVDSIIDDDNFTVIDDTLVNSINGTGSFKHPPGAKKIGFDSSAVSFSSSLIQDVIEEIDAQFAAITAGAIDIDLTGSRAADDASVINFSGSGGIVISVSEANGTASIDVSGSIGSAANQELLDVYVVGSELLTDAPVIDFSGSGGLIVSGTLTNNTASIDISAVIPTQINQVLFARTIGSFTAELPLTSIAGWLVNDTGSLLIVG